MTKARIVVHCDAVVSDVDRRFCGSFVEHLGRNVYEGLYEPEAGLGDEDGFRQDVIDLVKEMGVTLVRYPGGNFVSSYEWQDGVGPAEMRRPKLDLAWRALESNEFGLNEFIKWCGAVEVEPFLVFNLGTRGVESACQLIEYCNGRASSAWAELRRSHGYDRPHGVKLWGLGNEMDGDWQIGAAGADAYGSIAGQVARAVRRVDPSIELVAAGSSLRSMATFPQWDRVVLERVYDDVDYLALHQYFPANVLDEQSFLASGADLDEYILAAVATCDYVREVKRSRRRLHLAVDEWNVNYRHDEHEPFWEGAPAIGEQDYTYRDAVVVGSLLIALLRHADRVKVACQSLLVNVAAPIRTVRGRRAWKQAIYGPLAAAFGAAKGAKVLEGLVESPDVPTAAYGDVPVVDAVAMLSEDGRKVTVFAVNRSATEPIDLVVDLRGWGEVRTSRCRKVVGSATVGDGGPVSAKVVLSAEGERVLPLGPATWVALELGI